MDDPIDRNKCLVDIELARAETCSAEIIHELKQLEAEFLGIEAIYEEKQTDDISNVKVMSTAI